MTALFISVFIVLLVSALCSGTEAALFSTPIIKVRQLAESGSAAGKALLLIRERMNRPIAMIVILNNIANIVGSIVVGGIATEVLGARWLGVFSGVLTFLVILFAEIIPKTLGETYNLKISLIMARPVLGLTKLLIPAIWLVELMTKPFTKGGSSPFSTDEKEIRYLAQLGEQEGVIEHDELQMLQGVFQLNDITAKDLMTPRVALTCLSVSDTLEQAKQVILDSQHSRMVVIGESRDDVRGVALQSELLAALVTDQGQSPVSEYTGKPLEVSLEIKADELLPLFQSSRQLLAVVKDEFDGVAGVVTLEDVVEQLTGEIIDETDKDTDMREVGHRG